MPATAATRQPGTPAEVASIIAGTPDKKMGPNTNDNTGHTEWPDGAVHHSGFTTLLPPNTKATYIHNGKELDCDDLPHEQWTRG